MARLYGGMLGNTAALLGTAMCLLGICGITAGTGCPPYSCHTPRQTFVTKHTGADKECHEPGSVILIVCQKGFMPSGNGEGDDDQFAVCEIDGTWTWSHKCTMDVFSVILAGIIASVLVIVVLSAVYCIVSVCRPKKTKTGKEKEVHRKDAVADTA